MDYITLYHEFSYKVFGYLKKTLLCDFPFMKLDIVYDTRIRNQWGGNEFTKLSLYIYGFFGEHFTNTVHIKNQIIYCLLHEAYHQLQFTDDNKYSIDLNYKKFVERNVDYSTMTYINEHNLELQKELGLIVYEYNIDTLSNHYDKGGILINKDYIDMKYFNKMINKFINISNLEVYRLFNKYGKIIIHFVMNDENNIYQYTIRDNFVLDFEKMNDMIIRFMYTGYDQRIYRATMLEKKDEVIFSIYMNNKNIKFMERV